MATVIIQAEMSTKPEKYKLERELLWYDGEMQVMHKFNGGKLKFVYAYDAKLGKHRLLPEVEDVEINRDKIVSNASEIKNWFNEFVDDNNSQIDLVLEDDKEGWLEFDVPYRELSKFTNQLHSEGMKYTVQDVTS
tara:strand:- start:1805 stop:2209 length:405 start_codon:yes stop_codon:yes gene_type:complete